MIDKGNFNSFNSYCDNIKDKDIEIYITIYMRIFKMLKIKIIKLQILFGFLGVLIRMIVITIRIFM